MRCVGVGWGISFPYLVYNPTLCQCVLAFAKHKSSKAIPRYTLCCPKYVLSEELKIALFIQTV